MVEWWESGGDLDDGSFRALSFATEYSTSIYFTDSDVKPSKSQRRQSHRGVLPDVTVTVANNPAANTM